MANGRTQDGAGQQTGQHERLARQIEHEIEAQAGISVIAEETADAIVLSGRVDTPEAKQAASDVAATLATGKRIDNDLEVEGTLPVTVSEFHNDVSPTDPTPENVAEIRAAGADLDPDFTDQKLDTTALNMAGVLPRTDPRQDEDAEPETFFPPTDPVITSDSQGEVKVLGGFSATSDESIRVAPSSDGTLGDEAIAEAIRRELSEDSSTTALQIIVVVRNGVAHLRGTVEDVEDAENVEGVASRVPGVREVVEELTVKAI
jgi:osmotically-inducible protein OsmY